MLMPIRASGTKPPLFLVHGAHGDVPLGTIVAHALDRVVALTRAPGNVAIRSSCRIRATRSRHARFPSISATGLRSNNRSAASAGLLCSLLKTAAERAGDRN